MNQNPPQDQIRHLLMQWGKAFRAKDVDAIMSVYAPGEVVVAFDVVPPLAKVGRDAYRQNYEEFFARTPKDRRRGPRHSI